MGEGKEMALGTSDRLQQGGDEYPDHGKDGLPHSQIIEEKLIE